MSNAGENVKVLVSYLIVSRKNFNSNILWNIYKYFFLLKLECYKQNKNRPINKLEL